jgi:hypothetical protein
MYLKIYSEVARTVLILKEARLGGASSMEKSSMAKPSKSLQELLLPKTNRNMTVG